MVSIWYISKYCRLPCEEIDFSDSFQVKGAFPARGFCLLRELAKSGFSCTLINARHSHNLLRTRSASEKFRHIQGVSVCSLNVIGFKRAESIARVISWIHFEVSLFLLNKKKIVSPNVIIVSSLSLLSVINGIYLSKKYRVPLIFEVRDVWPLVLVENGGYSRHNPFVKMLSWIEKCGYKYAKKIVATMPNLQPHVWGTLGYSKEVHCIPMGVSPELEAGVDIAPYPEILSVFARFRRVITYAGSIGVDNALDVLFESAKQMSDETDVAFLIVGSGDLLAGYREKHRDVANLIFAGPVPHGMVQPILRQSTILFFSTHATPVLQFGQSLNKVIDYMFSARPIIGVMSGYRTMLNEAGCGVYVDAGDSRALTKELRRLVNLSDSELTNLGEKGADWVASNRSYEVLARQYGALVMDSIGVNQVGNDSNILRY